MRRATALSEAVAATAPPESICAEYTVEEIEYRVNEEDALITLRDLLAERKFCAADVDPSQVVDVPFVVDRTPAT